MADIVDFKSAKMRLQKKWKAEIDEKLKKQDWYIDAKNEFRYKMAFVKMLFLIDVVLATIAYFIS